MASKHTTELTKDRFLQIVEGCESLQHFSEAYRKKDDNIEIESIGEGNTNYLYKVYIKSNTPKENGNGRCSVLVKNALPFPKVQNEASEQVPVERLRVESEWLKEAAKIFPDGVPTLHCYSATHHCIVTDYLSDYVTISEQVMKRDKVDKVAPQMVAKNIALLHTKTHRTNLSSDDFEKLKVKFSNPTMLELQKRLMFEIPYENLEKSSRIYNDPKVIAEVTKLKELFTGSGECLIHSDLNLSSIMVKSDQSEPAKIIDGEMAHIGCAAQDLSKLIGCYIISYYKHMLCEENNPLHRNIAYKALEVISTIGTTYEEHFNPTLPDKKHYFEDEFWPRVSGFVGVELLHPTNGLCQMQELPDSVKTEIVQCGGRLVVAGSKISSVNKLTFIGLQMC